MRFLIDNQLAAALAVFLRELRFQAKHVPEVGLDEALEKIEPKFAEIIIREDISECMSRGVAEDAEGF
jgi:predicted nuclease of predicted toxin-antitoxin system